VNVLAFSKNNVMANGAQGASVWNSIVNGQRAIAMRHADKKTAMYDIDIDVEG
jgi:hypothetical protein